MLPPWESIGAWPPRQLWGTMPTEARESVVATNRPGAPLTIELSEARWSVVYEQLRSTTPAEAHWDTWQFTVMPGTNG
eukprot:10679519-Alexandrium_andersonii.AAC.1